MIILILSIGIILLFVGALVLPNRISRISVTLVGILIALGATIILVGNSKRHWGMKQVTTTNRTTITSTSPTKQLSVLVYQPLQNSKTKRVYVYRTMDSDQEQRTSASSTTHNKVTHQATTTAQLETKTTTWHYRNHRWRVLFSHTGKHTNLVKQTNTFILPHNWVTLTSQQAQWLNAATKEQAKSNQKNKKKAVTKIVKQQAVTREFNKQEPKQLKRLVKLAKQQAN
ncbi:DUF4811 domain-containing protein [Levilactobacillus suantsaii]|uniref:DUF4811 domain-containing protein n=1 Tax=Levilactobacillus suantsaii TaxID=2292255 RepID=A0A4Q0VKT0_9LACO|nr:DUF4811 domain-containing protein [Levilactobacillus suantsaii]QMU08268.1 DUF4811 domain-containing protein [Levilactobacillus suantsaii]RXI78792.1 DUF4811 domain-containing protein [Levilactobacillus suantsaii]